MMSFRVVKFFCFRSQIIKVWVSKNWDKYYQSLSLHRPGRSDRSDRLNLYDLVGPTIIKNKKQYISLSHTQLTLSPSPSLSLPLSLTSSLSHPNPRLQIPHPKSISRPWELQIRVEDHLLHVFLPGEPCIGFQVLCGEKAHPRYIKFVSARSFFLGWLEWFPLVNHLHRSYWTRA